MSTNTAFRSLNEHELTAIESSLAKRKLDESHPLVTSPENAKISYEFMQGGFCVCLIKSLFCDYAGFSCLNLI